MLVRNNPMIDYDELEQQIGEVQQVLSESMAAGIGSGVPAMGAASLFLLPELKPAQAQEPAKNAAELFAKQGQAFIEQAYVTFLGRMPDASGFADFLARLSQGESTHDLAISLMTSAEGVSKGAQLEGFQLTKKALLLHRLKRLPVLGKVLRWGLALKNLSRIQSRLNQAEFQLWEKEQQYLEVVDEWRKELLQVNQQLMQNSQLQALELQALKNRQAQEMTGIAPAAHSNMPSTRQQEDQFEAEFYLAFENKFRGDEADITSRLQVYMPLVDELLASPGIEKKTWLDIGCGRGEWLQLLKARGAVVSGLDINPIMVEACQKKGLPVVCEDAIYWLTRQPDQSLAMISGFHIIEHLPFGMALTLLRESLRCLMPGGVLLLETPNPDNLMVGANSFYWDPTHIKPVPPPLLQFMAEFQGFSEASILPVNPIPEELQVHEDTEAARRINHFMYSAQDYALIARR